MTSFENSFFVRFFLFSSFPPLAFFGSLSLCFFTQICKVKTSFSATTEFLVDPGDIEREEKKEKEKTRGPERSSALLSSLGEKSGHR